MGKGFLKSHERILKSLRIDSFRFSFETDGFCRNTNLSFLRFLKVKLPLFYGLKNSSLE